MCAFLNGAASRFTCYVTIVAGCYASGFLSVKTTSATFWCLTHLFASLVQMNPEKKQTPKSTAQSGIFSATKMAVIKLKKQIASRIFIKELPFFHRL
jgi:hypothetical protein